MVYAIVGFLICLLYELDSIRSYAKDISAALQNIQSEIHEELQWHKDGTFSHDLREWIGEVEKSLSKVEINTDCLTNIEVNTDSLTDIRSSLSLIESNTQT